MVLLICLILILELLDILRFHFTFALRQPKNFKFDIVILPLTGDVFI